MTDKLDKELSEIQQLYDAWPEPWRVAGGIVIRGGTSGTQEIASPPLSSHDNTQAYTIAGLITVLHNVWPRLLTIVSGLRAELAKRESEIQDQMNLNVKAQRELAALKAKDEWQPELQSRIEGLTLTSSNDFARGYNKALVDIIELFPAPPVGLTEQGE